MDRLGRDTGGRAGAPMDVALRAETVQLQGWLKKARPRLRELALAGLSNLGHTL